MKRTLLLTGLALAMVGCGGYPDSKTLAVVTLTGASLNDGRIIANPNNGFYLGPGAACADDSAQSWCIDGSDSGKKQITFYTGTTQSPFRIYIENKSQSDETFHLKITLDSDTTFDQDVATLASEKHEVGTLSGAGLSLAVPTVKKK